MIYTLLRQLRRFGAGIAIGVASLVMIAVISACAGFSAPNGSLTGAVSAVNAQNHSVTLNLNGQSITVNGLTDQEIAQIQPQVGKTFSLQANANSNGTYTIVAGSNITNVTTSETPGVNNDNATPAGSIDFIGNVQSVNNGNIVVRMPDGSALSLIVNAQTDNSDFNGVQPVQGQNIKVKATANADGSFLASELKAADSGDLQDRNSVEYQGVKTGAVGPDGLIHFNVGSKSYSFHIAGDADLGDFNNSAQSIGNNQAVKVEVLYQGTTGTVTKVSNASN